MAEVEKNATQTECAVFWIRAASYPFDFFAYYVISAIIIYGSLVAFGLRGWHELYEFMPPFWISVLGAVTEGLPVLIMLGFWLTWSASPVKLLLGQKILDAKMYSKPTTAQFLLRTIGCFVAGIPFGLGFFFIGLDLRKHGWHDKIAGATVVRKDGSKSRASGSVFAAIFIVIFFLFIGSCMARITPS